MPFRFLEHPADIRFECFGKNPQELFESAAQALYAVALRSHRDSVEDSRDISLHADGWEELLVRWLQELLYLLDTERFVASRFDFKRICDNNLYVVAQGYSCEPTDREREVKAATYHGLHLAKDGDELRAELVLDL